MSTNCITVSDPVVEISTVNFGPAGPAGSQEGTAVLSTGETNGTKFLREDGDGTSSWQTVAGGGGGLDNIVEDTTPQLGGNLDPNGFNTAGVTPTEMAFLSGITSSVQDQFDANHVYVTHIGHTGVANGGGLLSINGDTTKFDISDGFGYILDLVTDDVNPSKTRVEWSDEDALSVDNILTSNLSFIGIDINGDVVQQVTPFSEEQHRSIIVLGVLSHTANTVVETTTDASTTRMPSLRSPGGGQAGATRKTLSGLRSRCTTPAR